MCQAVHCPGEKDLLCPAGFQQHWAVLSAAEGAAQLELGKAEV